MYFVYFFTAFILALTFSLAIRHLARQYGVVDRPDGGRKRHGAPIPLLGGLAIFISFWSIVLFILYVRPIFGVELLADKLLGALAASLVIVLVGAADDIRRLTPFARLAWSALAVLVALGFGIGLDRVTNPLGGAIALTFWPVSLGGKTFFILPSLIVFLWLLGMMFTVKITDGLDGLAAGIVGIGALMLGFLSVWTKFYQPNVALLSFIFAGSILGFLIFNFRPASLFLGEGGGLFLGFMLGVLAIISGGKVAITLLVMAVPVIDLARVIYARLSRRQPVSLGDRSHLHFALLDAGLSERQTVLVFYAAAALFGGLALFTQTTAKLAAFLLIIIVVLSGAARISLRKF